MPNVFFPVASPSARISSGIGSRTAPIAGASTNHRGIDISATRGAPVVAPLDLHIDFAGQAKGYGNVIYGVDAFGNQHRFAHLDSFGVQTGDVISAGMPIGAVGSTGNSTGPHLHYEVRDKAGKFLADATETVISKGKKLATSALNGFLKSNPVTAPLAIGASFAGINPFDGSSDGGCGVNPICHLQKWFEETGFIQRAALFILAVVLIIGGIVFLGKGIATDTLGKALK